MITNKSINLALKLIGFSLLMGVIVFPYWWETIIQPGGLNWILYEAVTTFLLWNVIGLLVIYLLVMKVKKLEESNSAAYTEIQEFLSGKQAVIFWGALLIVATLRLWNASISYQNDGFVIVTDKISKQIEALEKLQDKNSAIKGVIEPIYINKNKVQDLYAQISPKLTLSEKSIGNKRANSIQAELGSEGIASIGGKSEVNGEETEKYKSRKLTISEELVTSVNHLNKNDHLIKLKPIEVDSTELTSLNDALIVLSKYEIPFDKEKVGLIKTEITNLAIKDKLLETYKTNSWILLSGSIKMVFDEVNQKITASFNYIPEQNNTVEFSCNIPAKGIAPEELSVLKTESHWDLNVFGKIIHKNKDSFVKYKITCLTMYR